MAYDPFPLPSRLPVHSVGRKQAGARASIPEPADHHGVMRTLAWSELDIRDLGGFAWRVSSDQPWLAQAGACLRSCDWLGRNVSIRRLWLGLVPGRYGTRLYLETPAPQLAALARFFGYELGFGISIGRWTIYPVDVLLSAPVVHTCWLVASALIVLRLPNAREWLGAAPHDSEAPLTLRRALFIGGLLFLVWLASITSQSGGFIYENF